MYVIRMPLVRTRMPSVCHSYVLACHPNITRMYTMSFVCHSYVILCHPYVTRMYSYATRMYSYAIRMSLVCTCMSSVCHSYVLVCHPYVTRMSSLCHSYVVLPWTILHWLWMLKLCIEVQFTKFMNIFFFSSVGITPVKWHKYQEQRRSRRRSTHFCKLNTIGNVVSKWEEKCNSENATRISNIKNTTMQYTTVLEIPWNKMGSI